MSLMNINPPIHDTFGTLWEQNNEKFSVNENCLEILEEILVELSSEDYTLRTFRRAIGFGQNIRKNLIPLLINIKNQNINNSSKILDALIKLLVNLTIPIEYLLPLEIHSQTDIGKHSIFELNNLLATSKEAFADSKCTKAVLDHIKYIIEGDCPLNAEKCESINNCLLLLRNILHIPETNGSSYSSLHNQIIWNLFTQSVDKIIIFLISCSERQYWSVTIVQLIALLYKDQHVGNLQKLLNLWLETSLSDSSEDNESNTSPPNQKSGDSSSFVTSDPTSDSSDTGACNDNLTCQSSKNIKPTLRKTQNRSKNLSDIERVQSTETEASSSSGVSSMEKSMVKPTKDQTKIAKLECPSSQSEISDCGYGTQMENQEFVSTSSNDDDQPSKKPIHQKPHSFQKTRYNKNRTTTALEKKELRRKKLVKRSKTSRINMKGLMHHLPTEEEVSNILKEFTVDFLLKGYGTLVKDLHTQLLSNVHIHIDTSHFFWLVTYFLKFASQLELDLEHIYSVLSYDLISYLIFQGVWIFEEIEILSKLNIDLKPCLRRLHLVVTAIKEFMQTIEVYQKINHLSEKDQIYLENLQLKMANTEDFGSLFILLLRHFNPNIQSKQYLQELIVTNHNYLLFLENVYKVNTTIPKINIIEHLKKFATMEIMHQYGLLLENFKQNGEFVNNCVFTMMHHIGGDLENVPTLYQPSILKTFSQIWETDYEICDDWSDLIEYVIHKFINSPRSNSVTPVISKALDHLSQTNNNSSGDTNEQNNSPKSNDCDKIFNLTEKCELSGIKQKTQVSIIKELLMQNIIKEEELDSYLDCQKLAKEEIQNTQEKKVQIALNSDSFDNIIEAVKYFLIKENKENYILWLQDVLLEMCYAKLKLISNEDLRFGDKIVEPVIYYSSMLNLPVPLVPWTSEQNSILKYQPFILLLHKLGLYLPVDTGKVFVRIPTFWNADYIYNLAEQLGPIRINRLKFDTAMLQKISGNQFYIHKNEAKDALKKTNNFCKNDFQAVRYTPLINPLSIEIPEEIITWDSSDLDVSGTVTESQHESTSNAFLTVNDEMEHNSLSETASVASDLTRMCVSDEDDKVIVLIESQ